MITPSALPRLVSISLALATATAFAACGGGSRSATPSATSTAASSATGPSATSAATTTVAPAGSPTPAAVSGADQTAAEATLFGYYAAINAQDYATAYRLWAGNGAASKQTEAQFAQGFTNTVRVVAQLGTASAGQNGLVIPVNIIAVVNIPTTPQAGDQAVRQFTGAYHMERQAGAWRIASADVTQGADLTAVPVDIADPITALNSYYAALNAAEFGRAFAYWSNEGVGSGQSFTEFVAGYESTKSTEAHFGTPQEGGAAGSIYATVPAVVIGTLRDGTQQAFCGVYTMRKLNVRPFQLLGWRIDSAKMKPLTTVPAAATIPALLTNGC